MKTVKWICLAIVVAVWCDTALACPNHQTVFGPKTVTMSMWGSHFSCHHFRIDSPGEGTLLLKKRTPSKRLWGGFLVINGRIISLKSFLGGDRTNLIKNLHLCPHNKLIVFLIGNPGASLRLEIKQKFENTPPTSSDDAVSTEENTPVTTPNVLLNDSDADGDTLVVSDFSQPANGTVVSHGDATFTYTPNDGFNGADSFTYTVSDGRGGSATAVVEIQVVPGPLTLEISSPTTGQEFTSASITVSGTVNRPGASVFVNGIAATVNGNEYTADDVSLVPGINAISVLAENGDDTRIVSVTVMLLATVDLEPVRLELASDMEDDDSGKVSGQATVTVANTGSMAVARPYRILLFEDTNTNLQYDADEDNRLGETTVAEGPGAGEAINAAVDFSGQLLFRDNRIHAFVDSADEIQEGDEDNNIVATRRDGIDLSASLLAIDTSGCPAEVALSVRIGNAGDASIQGGIPVAFYNGDPDNGGMLIGSVDTSQELEPGQYEDLAIRWIEPAAGIPVVYALADDDGTGSGVLVEIDEDNNMAFAEIPVCIAPSISEGISGQAIDALTGAFLSNVTVVLHADENGNPGTVVDQTASDAHGGFAFSQVLPGAYILTADSQGYDSPSRSVVLAADERLTHQDIVLSPLLNPGEFRIVLTWGEHPADLEAHLTAPNPDGCRQHCFYWNPTIPGASLDVDDRESYGPETITLSRMDPGTYRFYVHDFTSRNAPNSSALAASEATVTVYSGSGDAPRVFTVPAGTGNVWHVFNLDGDSGRITPVHNLTYQSQPGKIDFPRITSFPVAHAIYGEPYTYPVEAEDPDADTLTYTLVEGPDGMVIDPFSGLIQWTPVAGQGSWFDAEVRVSDGRCGSDTQKYTGFLTYLPVVRFEVDPCSGFNPGGEITLTWQTERAETVVIDPGIGEVQTSGSLTIPSPEQPIAYTLTAVNGAGETRKTVPRKPTFNSLNAGCAISPGEAVSIDWISNCSAICNIDQGIGEVPASGALSVMPSELPTTYTITCANGGGTSSGKFNVSYCQPNATIDADVDCNWFPGDPVMLNWETSQTDNCSISPDVGSVPPKGSVDVYPVSEPATYRLSCDGVADKVVIDPRKIEFQASKTTILPGESMTLHWKTRCYDTCSIDQGIGSVPASGSVAVAPDQLPVTYTLTAAYGQYSVNKPVTVSMSNPVATFSSSPALIKTGESATLTWKTDLATSCTIEPDIGEVDVTGSIAVSPDQNTTYTLTVAGPGGTTVRRANVTYVKPTAAIQADPEHLDAVGQSSTLTWVFGNADSCVIDPGIGEVQLGGGMVVTPARTTTYTITATGPGGTAKDSVTVSFPHPAVEIHADRETLDEGETATLTWTFENADTCSIEPGIGEVQSGDSFVVDPDRTTTYTIAATGPGGAATDQVTLTCLEPNADLQVNPVTVIEGQAATLSWQADHAADFVIQPEIGMVDSNGSIAVSPAVTTTYILTASGRGGETAAQATLTILNPPSIHITEPDGNDDKAHTGYTIRWIDTDADSDAVIALFYDINDAGADGTPIISGIQEDPDGLNDAYIWDTTGIPAGSYYVYARIEDGVNDPVIAYSEGMLTIDHSVTDETKLTAADGEAYDAFGSAVAIDGDYAVAGAPNCDGGGAVYLYRHEGSGWNKQIKWVAGGASDRFGESVSISGDTVVAGAPGENEGQGEVIVFTDDGSVWERQARLTAADGAASDSFGASVAISGDTLLVGAPDQSGQVGVAYVFSREGSTWGSPVTLTAGSNDGAGRFGASVSIHGNVLIVGAPSAENGAGAAYVFRQADTEWVEEARLTASDARDWSRFGNSVSINGATAIVGNVGMSEMMIDAAAYIFVYSGATWSEQTRIGASDVDAGEKFAAAVSINGNLAAVGQPDSWGSGAVYLFTRNGDQWIGQDTTDSGEGEGEGEGGESPEEPNPSNAFQKLTPGDGEEGDLFGACLATDDNQVIVGAPSDDDKDYGSGSAYIYPLFSVEIFADPETIRLDGEGSASTTLSWTSRGVDSVTIDPDIGAVDTSGSLLVNPLQTTTYTITGADSDGAAITDSVIVTVIDPTVMPTVTISAAPETIARGESAILTWSAANVASVTLDNEIGTAPMSGSLFVSPLETTTYTVTAANGAGSATASVTVTVSDPLPALELVIDSPVDGVVIDNPILQVTGQVSSAATVTVNGADATVAGTDFSAQVALDGEGQHAITAIAVDSYDQEASATVTVTLDYPELLIDIESPANDAMLYSPVVEVSGEVSVGASVTVNGIDATVSGTNFNVEVTLEEEGQQVITATAVDVCGQQASDHVIVNYHSIPSATLTTSSHFTLFGSTATLNWSSENCDSCLLEPLMIEVPCNGSMEVAPEVDTVYTINATGLGLTARDSVTVMVDNGYGNPGVEEQLHLEAINRARANPLAEAERLQIDLNEGPPSENIGEDPVQPLVFNANLALAAALHSADMAEQHYFAHEGLDGRLPRDRAADAGYDGDGVGENLAFYSWTGEPNDDTYWLSNILHDILFIDEGIDGRGHRINMLKAGWKEIGIGFNPEPYQIDYPYGGVITCNFGAFTSGPNFLLGVVYDDADNSGDYTGGEGLALAKIEADGNEVRTADAGGYGMPVEPGTHTVTATLPDGRMASKTVTVTDQNKKIDFTLADFASDPLLGLDVTPESPLIHQGQTVRLIWTSQHARTVSVDQGIGVVPGNGAIEFSPMENIDYTFTATNSDGSVSQTIHVTVLDPLPGLTLSATPQSVWPGESVELSWTSEHADACWFDQGIGTVDLSGSLTVFPDTTTTYTLYAENDQGISSQPVTVSVQRTEVDLDADSQFIASRESATMQWTATNAETCSVDQGIGDVDVTGSLTLSPTVTTIYSITCQGYGTSDTGSFTVYVEDAVQPPVASIGADETVVEKGGSVTLAWQSNNGNTFRIDNGIGEVERNGSMLVSPEYTTTYTFTVIGPNGIAQSDITIFVTGSPYPQPAGAFGTAYEDLIPVDATIDDYDPRRFALMTGVVRDIADAGLPYVAVTVLDHPEYGTAFTDGQGRYAIPVEGGGRLTLAFDKDSYIPCQRSGEVPWNDILVIDDLQMITEDPVATTMVLDGDPDTVVSHRASVISDADGQRSSTLVFAGDTGVIAVDENGNDIVALRTVTVRATEFTTPRSMPAVLPPTSAFTYCAEMQVDGVARVRFEKPVISWVDNFLGFDVGEVVPVGYYDHQAAKWVPENNGVVVRLLDTDSDGVVDALDDDGDGIADDLDNDGSFDDEVAGLSDADAYPPESTFWRIALDHFSTVDYNYPAAGAIAPDSSIDLSVNAQEKDEICYVTGSYVECKSQNFHEEIPVPGTPFHLHYSSDRTVGYHTVFNVQASGATVPDTLKEILVEARVAGKTYTQSLAGLPNRTSEIVWDGLDFRGQPVTGPIDARVSIGYVYDGFYASAGDYPQSFGQPGTQLTTVPARREVVWWKNFDMPLNRKQGTLAEGWTLSHHHQVSAVNPATLIKGNGFSASRRVDIVEPFAGGGTGGDAWLDGPAIDAYLPAPFDTVCDGAGNTFVSDRAANRVYKIDADGIISAVAGDGTQGYSGDGEAALSAQLNWPCGLAIGSDGSLYIADSENHCVRKVDPEGMITTIAGTGVEGDSGDGGLAINAELTTPNGVLVDSHGNIFIADEFAHRVRKIDPNGIIQTYAGTGIAGSSDSGVDARQAKLRQPCGLAMDRAGNLYLSEFKNHCVRKVDTAGIISDFAGQRGEAGFTGDGGPALEARLQQPLGLVFDDEENLYITSRWNHRVRRVDQNGIISTVAGSGAPGFGGFSGDGLPAPQARFDNITSIKMTPAGNFLVVDSENQCIREIKMHQPKNNWVGTSDFFFPDSENELHYFTSDGRHAETVVPDTGKVLYTFVYNSQDRLSSITDRFGNTTVIRWYSNGVPYEIESPDGLVTRLTVDAYNQLTAIDYPDNSGYVFEYENNDGLLTAKVDPENHRFDHFFDDNGRVTETFDDEGGHWQFSRTVEESGEIVSDTLSAEGNLTRLVKSESPSGEEETRTVRPSGDSSLVRHTADGVTTTRTDGCGTATTTTTGIDPDFGYDYVASSVRTTPAGLSLAIQRQRTRSDTDADGDIDTIDETVTVNGRVATVTDHFEEGYSVATSPEGRSSTVYYDSATLLPARTEIPGLADVEYGFDAKGRLTSVLTGTRKTIYTYTNDGFLASVTDPEQTTVTYDHDALGRVTAVTRPDAGIIHFAYDNNGNMTLLTNADTIDHGFSYSAVGKRNGYQTPLSGSYSYDFDKDRRLTAIDFPSGQQILYEYDPALLTRVVTPEGNIDYAYTCGDQVRTITKDSESIGYTYDGSLLTGVTLSGSLNRSIGLTYNDDLRVTAIEYAGSSETVTYDNDGLLTGLGAFVIGRNADNGLPETVNDGSYTLQRGFNTYGEIDEESVDVNGSPVYTIQMERDDNGRIYRKTEILSGMTTVYDYTYDLAGRLQTVEQDGTLVESYQYNTTGTRSYEENGLRDIAGRSLSYSDEDHLLTAGDATYQYDLDGFLTHKSDVNGDTVYDYASRGELLTVTLPDGTHIAYDHDPLGRRIAKKIDGITVEKYLWQGLTRLLAVYDGADNLLQRFEYADARMPVAMVVGGVRYYLIYDQVGTLRAVTDGSGAIVKRIDYDSFGNVIADSNPGFAVPFGFAGGLHDRDTGLVRFGYRDYDPATGRWTAKDPIDFAGGDTDLFGYVQNDPVNFIDPNGLVLIQINRAIKAAFAASQARASFLVDLGSSVIQKTFNIYLPAATTSAFGIASGAVLFVVANPSDSIINEQTELYYLRNYNNKNPCP